MDKSFSAVLGYSPTGYNWYTGQRYVRLLYYDAHCPLSFSVYYIDSYSILALMSHALYN
jgi:hypothetical protein